MGGGVGAGGGEGVEKAREAAPEEILKAGALRGPTVVPGGPMGTDGAGGLGTACFLNPGWGRLPTARVGRTSPPRGEGPGTE